MHLFADYFDLIWVIVCFHIVTIKIFQAFWAAFYVLLVQLLHFRLLIGVKSNHFRAIQRGDLLPSIRLDFVWLYNGTEKALLIGSAIRVWYTIVFHCIDIERVRTMGSDGVQCGAVGYMIVVAAWRFFFPIWQSCKALVGYAICDHKRGDMLWCFMHPSCVCDHVSKTHWFYTLFSNRVKNYQLI